MLKNIASNWLLSLVTLVVTYILTPFTIHRLGEGSYGTWVLISATTGYLLLLSLGVPMASVRYMAQYAAEEKREELNAAIASSTALYIALGIAVFAICSILFLFFDSVYAVPAGLHSQARIAFVVMLFYISASFVGQLPYGILAAHHDFVRRNAVQLSGLLLRLALTLLLLTLVPSFVCLAIVLFATLLF